MKGPNLSVSWQWDSRQPSPGKAPGWVKFLGILFLLVGLAFLGAGIWSYQSTAQFVDSARLADGTVVKFVSRRSSSRHSDGSRSSRTTWCAVVNFDDHHGNHHTFESSVCSNPARYRQGERISVLYAADNPAHAKINDYWSLYFFVWVCAFMGSIFTVLGGGVTWVTVVAKILPSKKTRTPTVS